MYQLLRSLSYIHSVGICREFWLLLAERIFGMILIRSGLCLSFSFS